MRYSQALVGLEAHPQDAALEPMLHSIQQAYRDCFRGTVMVIKGKAERRRVQPESETNEVIAEDAGAGTPPSDTFESPRPRKSKSQASLEIRSMNGGKKEDMAHSIGHENLGRPNGSHGGPSDRTRSRTDGSTNAPTTRTPEQAAELLREQFQAVGSNLPYINKRQTLLADERRQRWDEPARQDASPVELEAQKIVFKIREDERRKHFGNLPGEAIPSKDSRDMGGHFLRNKDKIMTSKIFEIALLLPKGSHLHLHFNSEIQPELLFPRARELTQTFYVRCTRPILSNDDFNDQLTEIVFNVLPASTLKADIFSPNYNPVWRGPGSEKGPSWMLWSEFRRKFPSHIQVREGDNNRHDFDFEHALEPAELWARGKMVVDPDTAYAGTNTHNEAWACFNIGTRAFKGLVGYEGIYRWYIGQAIDSMIRDKVMYAELRPMLLDKTIPSDDGERQLDHKQQMDMVCEEIKKKQKELEANGELEKFPFGIKIIYCAPRSISRNMMERELQDCIKLKLAHDDLICGFDLVGAEDRPNSVSFYADLLVAFTETCKTLGIRIPFMFHAGETLLDTGGSANPEKSNLYDALLLNAKRIGHGYALLKHPVLVEEYRENKICLELCPISNELLHLCGNAREHPFPALLAAGLHCTLNADNPSLFRSLAADSSSLSHEFYQVMVGDPRMTIHGWKQLGEWSIEHSCISPAQIEEGLRILRADFEEFCKKVVHKYGPYAETLDYPQ